MPSDGSKRDRPDPSWDEIERAWRPERSPSSRRFQRRIGRWWFIIGLLGAGIAAAVLVAHFELGVPVYCGRTGDKLASAPEIIFISLAIAGGSALFVILGGALYATGAEPGGLKPPPSGE